METTERTTANEANTERYERVFRAIRDFKGSQGAEVLDPDVLTGKPEGLAAYLWPRLMALVLEKVRECPTDGWFGDGYECDSFPEHVKRKMDIALSRYDIITNYIRIGQPEGHANPHSPEGRVLGDHVRADYHKEKLAPITDAYTADMEAYTERRTRELIAEVESKLDGIFYVSVDGWKMGG